MLKTPMIAIDRETSGVDAGRIGYTINVAKVEALTEADLEELRAVVGAVLGSCMLNRLPAGGPR